MAPDGMAAAFLLGRGERQDEGQWPRAVDSGGAGGSQEQGAQGLATGALEDSDLLGGSCSHGRALANASVTASHSVSGHVAAASL